MGDLPPLLSRYVGLLGVTEQVLAEDIADELVTPLAEVEDGRQLLIARRYGETVTETTADLLARQAASLIAAGRSDVHRSLEQALVGVASRLQTDENPEVVQLGVAVAAAVKAIVLGSVPAPEGQH